MKKLLILSLLIIYTNAFLVSVGGFSACDSKYGSSYYKNCPFKKQKPLYNFLKKEAKNVNSITMWITRNWQENWYPANKVNNFIKNGYTPIFIFYFFADDISPSFVKKHQKEYFLLLDKFKKYLKKLNGAKIVVLNPEYNENGMEKSSYFDILQSKSILELKEINNTKVGVCIGDFGNYNLIWDKYAWDLNKPSLKYSTKLSDFIAFQEMRALTRNSKKEILNTPLRILALSTYLYNTYKKPTLLAYLAISSYKDEQLQAEVFKNIITLLPLYKNIGHLQGIGIFNYIDVPTHKGYFNEAEKYWGVKYKDGKIKESFKYFIKIK